MRGPLISLAALTLIAGMFFYVGYIFGEAAPCEEVISSEMHKIEPQQ